ncbi:hypothetical protein NDU88_005340 [Pleurodeles waltl]|uniref:Uncharacterized protein n=1 Tax=Pleurodeles waltl TaxID=8319 RepID=A0AAV7UIM5_PLEWA|nr:hypothetical protein NDU88_005340 [Pleurodeles waltl]
MRRGPRCQPGGAPLFNQAFQPDPVQALLLPCKPGGRIGPQRGPAQSDVMPQPGDAATSILRHRTAPRACLMPLLSLRQARQFGEAPSGG